MKKRSILIALSLLIIPLLQIQARNPRRPLDQTSPSLTITASNEDIAKTWISPKVKKRELSNTSIPIKKKGEHRKKSYVVTNQFLRYKPLKEGFNEKFFNEHYLPHNQLISFRDNSGAVMSNELDSLANELLNELKVGQTNFKHFIILKDKDFNYKNLSGLLVVKFKDYPFVIKLSIEHPHTMIKPYTKSFIANFIFIIGGNIRHLSNFTRISNLENIKFMLCHNPYYVQNISFPRKWYWKPKNSYDLHITWNKSPYKNEEIFVIPSAYAVIADLINEDPNYSQQELNKVAMKIATDTGFLIDPHAGNCVRDRDVNKYTLLDTENFRTMVGLEQNMHAKKYTGWYFEMVFNGLKTYSHRTKQERIRQSYDL